MSDDTPLLEFRQVSLSFDDTPVLRGVSFALQRGQMIFVTGESGAGKSVLLHLAMGLFHPDAGHVLLHGRELEALTEDKLLTLRGRAIGMVFQEQAAFTGLSVYDNTAFSLVEHGSSEAAAAREVADMLSFVGLQDDADKMPEELSGGMERRLEIARALIGWPPVMLYDEPTSGLDPITSEQVLKLILYARDARGVSSVIVTKDMAEIDFLAHQRVAVTSGGAWEVLPDDAAHRPATFVMVLEEGALIFTGSPTELFTSDLPAVTRLTKADNGTELSDFYTPDPWDKKRRPKEPVL